MRFSGSSSSIVKACHACVRDARSWRILNQSSAAEAQPPDRKQDADDRDDGAKNRPCHRAAHRAAADNPDTLQCEQKTEKRDDDAEHGDGYPHALTVGLTRRWMRGLVR
jgi:hypothetical protein